MNNNDTSEYQYLQNMLNILNYGDERPTRNGVRKTLFGTQMKFHLIDGFPLLTTKKVHFKSIIVELLWFIKGLTNTKYLNKYGVTIWDEWADKNGELGPVYGRQWRSWIINPCDDYNKYRIDQFQNVINSIKNDPYGTRHIVSAWNPDEIDEMALPPCHCLFQFDVTTKGELNLSLYQRSADWFLGVPFNIASYALLLILVARETGLVPGTFVHSFGNYHLYDNHYQQAYEQLARTPRNFPRIEIIANPEVSIFDLEPEDIILHDYHPHPAIKAEVSK